MEHDLLIAPEEPDGETLRVPVLKVFDGDGFLTRIADPRRNTELKVAVRFGFIDAPEMGQPGGGEARDFLISLIGGRWVDLTILMKMDTGGINDRHGRIVAVPYLRQQDGGHDDQSSSVLQRLWNGFVGSSFSRNIELEMVLNGWAWVLDRYEPDQRYFDALDEAQRNRRGIWAKDGNVHPWEFKKQRYQAKRQPRPNVTLQPRPNAKLDTHCPANCGGHLVKRSGRFGAFYGCSNFPKCRYSCSELRWVL